MTEPPGQALAAAHEYACLRTGERADYLLHVTLGPHVSACSHACCLDWPLAVDNAAFCRAVDKLVSTAFKAT